MQSLKSRSDDIQKKVYSCRSSKVDYSKSVVFWAIIELRSKFSIFAAIEHCGVVIISFLSNDAAKSLEAASKNILPRPVTQKIPC